MCGSLLEVVTELISIMPPHRSPFFQIPIVYMSIAICSCLPLFVLLFATVYQSLRCFCVSLLSTSTTLCECWYFLHFKAPKAAHLVMAPFSLPLPHGEHRVPLRAGRFRGSIGRWGQCQVACLRSRRSLLCISFVERWHR